MKKWGKHFVVFCVVCLLASSFAWAIPGIKQTSAEKPSATSTPEVIIIENSESEAKANYVSYEELSQILDGKIKVLGAERIDSILTTVDALEKTVNEQNDEIERQEQEIAEVKVAYAEVKAAYEKEIGTKYFADLGMAFGFRSDKLQYGFCADMGLRFGRGLMVKTGVQYMVADVGKFELPKFDSLEPMTVNVTVGWEW